MLAGAHGIDIVMMVIAADEGIMPQTVEHLQIISLLDVKKGIVVLTKCDLVDDEWLTLVEEEVREALKGTVLENVPFVPVSSTTGKGLDRTGCLTSTGGCAKLVNARYLPRGWMKFA